MIRKVIAYITRSDSDGQLELLVFEHRDYPDAGLQVPAGTVEDGEPPDAAVLREVKEETGLDGCRIVRKLGTYEWHNPYTSQVNERHVYHLSAPASTPDTWTWIETGGGVVPEQEGYVFLFRWEKLNSAVNLEGDQDDYFHEIILD